MAKRAGKQTSLIGSTEMKEPTSPHEEGPQNGDKKYEKNNRLLGNWLDKNFRNEGTKRGYYSYVNMFLNCIYSFETKKYVIEPHQTKAQYEKQKLRTKNKIEYFVDKYVADEKRVFLDDFKMVIISLINSEYSPTSINVSMNKIKKFFDRLNPEKYEISNRDMDDIKASLMPKSITATQDEITTRDELRQILTYLSVKNTALFLFLTCTGCRIGAVLQLKINDLNLDVNPPFAEIRGAYTKGGLSGRRVWFTDETKYALESWIKIKDTYLKKTGRRYDPDLLFGIGYSSTVASWNRALKRAGLDQRDPNTKKRIRKYHIHTLRKFFRTQMGEAGMPDLQVHALMGHRAYLSEAYDRPRELAKSYVKYMHSVTVFEKDLDAQILEEKQALTEKVQGMTIQDDKIRRTLEMFGEIMKIGDMKDMRTEDIIYTIESKVKDMMKTLAANAEEIAYLKETQGK